MKKYRKRPIIENKSTHRIIDTSITSPFIREYKSIFRIYEDIKISMKFNS